MSVMAEFSIFPVDKGEELSEYVARAVRIVKDSGLAYHFGPMGTTIEGDWDEVMEVIGRCFKDLQADCGRINLGVKVDYRDREGSRLEQKRESVLKRIED